MPFLVSVPVLSNTKVETCPAILTRGGAIQNMDYRFSRLRANATPMVIAAGNAGGTVIVIISRLRSTMSSTLSPFEICFGRITASPANARMNMTTKNRILSL